MPAAGAGGVKFRDAVEGYIADQFATGRFGSPHTEKGYRRTLHAHADDVGNRDPSKCNRDDVKRTLARWKNPNTRALAHAHLVSFYDWLMEEGYRKDNPARHVRRSRRRKPVVYRMTREEVRAFRAAARGDREKALADLGLLAGLRLSEIQGMQGRHFRRPGWIWVSADIGKGTKERWVPVLPEFEPTWVKIAQHVKDSEYVLPLQRSFWADRDYVYRTDSSQPMGDSSILRLVKTIATRAGISGRVTTHTLRHAYIDHVTRFAGIKIAQFVAGHASVSTTEGYTGTPTLDEIRNALAEFGFGTDDLSPADRPASPLVEPGSGLRVEPGSSDPERDPVHVGLAKVLARLWVDPDIRGASKDMRRAS
jgi:integrase/recombinase XerD